MTGDLQLRMKAHTEDMADQKAWKPEDFPCILYAIILPFILQN
jgi:hypothetical protein